MPGMTDHPDDFDREWAYRRGYAHGAEAVVAALWIRAAILGASPNTSPVASTTTCPESNLIRAESSGVPLAAFLALISTSARWIASPHGALGVVLLCVRIAEQRHQPVAELFQHVPAKPGHRPGSLVKIGVDEIAPILGVKLCGEARRAYEIAEHDRDRAALGRDSETLGRRRP